MFSAVILLLCLTKTVNVFGAVVKHHKDGSISSNNGPKVAFRRSRGFDEAVLRRLRSSFMIESKVRLMESRPLSDKQMMKIVDEHNKYRSMIPATNMEKIYWDQDLAMKAQKHADECTLEHTVDRGDTGENIWVSQYPDFSLAVRLWYEEVNDAQCDCKNAFKECCGHYTQLIWAETNKIGCGFAQCKSIIGASNFKYSFVCAYSPAGNLVSTDNGQFIGLPAYKELSGNNNNRCSECPSQTVCQNNLCDKL